MLSAIPFTECDSLGINYPGDPSFKVVQDYYTFTNGLDLYISPLLANVRDISQNKHELAILSDFVSLEETIDQNKKNTIPLEFVSTVQLPGIGFWYCDGTNVSITSEGTTDNNLFVFKIDPITDTIQVVFDGINYLTYVDSASALVFQSKLLINFNGVSPQIFNYLLDDNKIVLLTNFQSLSSQYTITFNTSANALSSTVPLSSNGNIPTNAKFTLVNYTLPEVDSSIAYGESRWIQYNKTSADVAIKKALSSVPTNVLITAPYKRIVDNKIQANINGLKNHLSPDYENNIDNIDKVNQRDYYSIIPSTPQDSGSGNVFLAYEGGTQGIVFKKNSNTWFHYPNTSQSINVNDTTIALNGAIASDSPFKSDKIFKKQANYKKYSNWGESLPIYEQNGAWLCTWLSGSLDTDTPSVWVDRYINPTLVNSISAPDQLVDLLLASNAEQCLTTTDLSGIEINGNSFITTLFSNYQQAYVDVVSQFTFDPGVLYIYQHLGEQDNKTVVSKLSGDLQSIYISDWNNTLTLDNTPNENNVNIIGTPLIILDDSLVYNTFFTNTSAYGITQFPINFGINDGFTLSVNIYAKDWSNLYGDQIVGNYFDGGVGIFVNNPILTPTFFTYETTQGRLLELNSDFYVLHEHKLSNVAVTSAVQYLFKRDYDEEYIVIDSGRNLLRYDSSNILLSAVALSSTITDNILDVQVDGLGNIYILASLSAYKYNISNNDLTYEFNTGGATKIAIDLNNNVRVLAPNVLDYCYDSDNNLFTVTSDTIYKNGNVAFHSTNIQKIACDIHDNLWVLHDNKISKLDNLPYHVFTSTVTLSTAGVMSLTFSYNLSGIGGVEESVIVVDETNKLITKLCNNGIGTTHTTNISALSGQFNIDNSMVLRLPKGDPSGYDYQRKYGRLKQQNNGLHVKVFTTHRKTQIPKIFTVYTDTKDLDAGWHNFTVTFSTQKGNLKMFIDGDLRTQTSSDINSYQYTYIPTNYRNEARLLFGTSSYKNGVLSDNIHQPRSYIFSGGLNEFRIYNQAFSSYIVPFISRNGYVQVYDDMSWNMPVGTNQYIEEIERFFQHRLPGNKSPMFNLKVCGYTPINDQVKQIFEDNIRQVLQKITPAYTQLNTIVWTD